MAATYVDVNFEACKRELTVLDVLQACQVPLERFVIKPDSITGPCPLHQGSNPGQWKADSGASKGRDYWLWKCFSCGEGGSSLTLAKKLLDLDDRGLRIWMIDQFGSRVGQGQVEAKEKASEGIAVGSHQPSPATNGTDCSIASNSELAKLKPLTWFYRVDPDCDYLLQDRRLKPDTIRHFGLGLVTKEKTWLSGYIAIPLRIPGQPPDSNPVSYLGRFAGECATWTDERPRYKFWKNFPRRAYVYGLAEALRDSSNQWLTLTEGCFDLYRIWQEAGMRNVVASLGSNLTDHHADLLASTGRNIAVLFDGNARDKAHQAGALLMSRGVSCVRVIPLPEDKQPDDLTGDEIRALIGFTQASQAHHV